MGGPRQAGQGHLCNDATTLRLEEELPGKSCGSVFEALCRLDILGALMQRISEGATPLSPAPPPPFQILLVQTLETNPHCSFMCQPQSQRYSFAAERIC